MLKFAHLQSQEQHIDGKNTESPDDHTYPDPIIIKINHPPIYTSGRLKQKFESSGLERWTRKRTVGCWR